VPRSSRSAARGIDVEATGLRLQPPDGVDVVTDPDTANAVMAEFGLRVWPLDLSVLPQRVNAVLDQPALSEEEDTLLRDHLFLSRERLVGLIEASGRQPHVHGGGSMSSVDTTHDVHYPELYIVAPGNDYGRFDRLHRNVAGDGTGVDEIVQVVAGRGFRIVYGLDPGRLLELVLDRCGDHGWIVTYSGAHPHIGSLAEASPGTKLLVQIIGPPAWTMDYLD